MTGLLLVFANRLVGVLGNLFVGFAEGGVGRLLRRRGVAIGEPFLVAVGGVVDQLLLGELETLGLAAAALGHRPLGRVVDWVVGCGAADPRRFGGGGFGLFLGDRVALWCVLAHQTFLSPQRPVSPWASCWG